MRLIDADALIEDSKKYLNTLNQDNDGKECTKIYWLINVLNEAPTVEQDQDAISRKAAIEIASGFCHPANIAKELAKLPSAQPQRLTDDDFETIRIHLNAHKEKLCNQHRWEEADEYQRIIDRFMAFASAQPEIIRCKDCKWKQGAECVRFADVRPFADDFCSRAERRTDGN